MLSNLPNRRDVIKKIGLAGAALTAPAFIRAQANSPIKVGVLHSLTGTMAMSETILKDTLLMAVEDINRKGGVLGRKIDPVVVDPASSPPRFAKQAEQLYTQDKVAAIFGGWTSASRKAILPVLDKTGGLLYYPVQYEGQEQHKNVFYTGCVPNQQSLPALDYLLSTSGGSRKRFLLVGTDYIYPRTTNAILRAYLKSKGIADADIVSLYRPFAHDNFQDIVSQARNMAKTKSTAIVSTINGDSNVAFYDTLIANKVSSEEIPSVAFSVGEEELRNIDTAGITGHLAAWNYFMSSQNAMNRDFIKRWSAYARDKKIPNHSTKPVVNDPMQASLVGINMWKQAVEKAQSLEPIKVISAMSGQVYPAPSGDFMRMDPENHHLYKTPMIGKIRADGQFDVVWKSSSTVRAQPWSPFLVKS